MIAPSATSQNWGKEKEEEFFKILQLETPLSAGVWNKELPCYPRYYLENVCIAAGSMVFVFVHKALLCPTLQDSASSNFIDENMLWSFKVNFGLTICAYVVRVPWKSLLFLCHPHPLFLLSCCQRIPLRWVLDCWTDNIVPSTTNLSFEGTADCPIPKANYTLPILHVRS
jgi:hypothetical protein